MATLTNMAEPNLDELSANTPPRRGTSVRGLPKEIQAARNHERLLRCARAQQLAKGALTRLYPADYRSLYTQAIDKIYSELGPLPGG